MNLLFLMAGSDKVFLDAEYSYPKNLIEINGMPLIQKVLNNFSTQIKEASNVIFLIKKDENQKYHTGSVLKLLNNSAKIIEIQNITAGAACTALLAVEYIHNDEPLLIINGDIIIENGVKKGIDSFVKNNKVDGGIIVFESVHPRWSYVKCNELEEVVEASEKRPISNLATVGIYYYKKGSDFVNSAMNMIKKNACIDGNFYICPAYNEMILKQKKIITYKIDQKKYFSLSTPQGIQIYKEYINKEK